MISKVMRDWPMMYVQNSSNLVAFFMFQFPFSNKVKLMIQSSND